jgi:outer membrane protein
MNHLLRKIVPGVLLMSLLSSSSWAQGRIATIDLRKVFDSYWKTKQAQASLKDRQADMEKEFKNMAADYDKAKQDYQKLLTDANDQALATGEREKRKRSAEDKLRYLKDQEETMRQYRAQATTTLDEQTRRMIDNILAEIRTVVAAKAKSAGHSLVVDTAAETANRTPIILFSTGENDMTDAVLSQLNSTAPAESAKPEEKKDEKKSGKK